MPTDDTRILDAEDHMPDRTVRRYSIAVDFDGVLHSYVTPWIAPHIIPDPPVGGAIPWLSKVLQKFHVYVLTTRARTWRGRRAVRSYLKEHAGNLWYPDPTGQVPMEEIQVTYKKHPCLIYIDDRGHRFDGTNWPSVDEIFRMKPWNKQDQR